MADSRPIFRAACVVGARPNFVKMSALLRAFDAHPAFEARLIHTGQHFSPEMSDLFFDELELPRPDYHLGIHEGTPTSRIAEMISRLERAFFELKPEVVVVVGDVDSTLAASLTASRMGIRTAHVEAGLRSRDRTMPEELNRLATDALSDWLFASEQSGVDNLRSESVSEDRIFYCGNVMIDTLLRFRDKAARSDVVGRLGLEPDGYVLATLHRPANVDDPERLRGLMRVLAALAERMPVLFPVHPRAKAKVEACGPFPAGLRLEPPQGYLDFLRLMQDARLMLTDSGGVQEETTVLGTPCLTLRENTERPATITDGTNRLVGVEPEAILQAADEALSSRVTGDRRPPLWDGRAAERIVDALADLLAS